MSKKRILVIEDNEKHIEDAKKNFADKDVEVEYVETFNEFWENFWNEGIMGDTFNKHHGFDGVISDIYFPETSESEEFQRSLLHKEGAPDSVELFPLGVRVALELSQNNVPFVLNTAGMHHGPKYSWICHMARSQEWPLVESGHSYWVDAGSKNWEEAYQKLHDLMSE